VLLVSVWIAEVHFATPRTQIESLAVLPLKSLDKNDNNWVGIADAVIGRVSKTGQLTVKPTSAVLKFSRDDTDSLAAGRQLNVDAVLEGTFRELVIVYELA
jgi:eukaryotic-like serine/threonine-protein kinase